MVAYIVTFRILSRWTASGQQSMRRNEVHRRPGRMARHRRWRPADMGSY
jgi:hypothetical protein